MDYKGKNRFTISDYVYDEEETRAESSQQGAALAALAQTRYHPIEEKQQRGALRLHRPQVSPAIEAYSNPLSPQRSLARSYSTDSNEMSETRSDENMLQPQRSISPPPPPRAGPGMMEMLAPRSPMSPNSFHSAQSNPAPRSPHSPFSPTIPYRVDMEAGGIDLGDHRSERLSVASDRMSEKRDSMVGNKESWAAVDLSHSQAQAKKNQWYHKIIPGTVYTRILLATIITETVINLTIEANILYRFNEEVKSTSSTELELENKRRLPIYLIIFGLAHLWQLVLVSIAIRMKNTVQVIAVTAFNFAFLGYAIIQIYELRKILGGTSLSEGLKGDDTGSTLMTIPLNVLTALIIAVVAVSSVGLLVLSVLLRREFGWQRYRFLGADLMIREYYFKFQIFECVCYFGAFFCAGFGIQFIWLVLNPSDVEYIITWIAFPLLIIFLVIGRYAAKYENAYFMSAFIVGLLTGCAYFIFKLVRIWQQRTTTYNHLEKSLTVFDALSLASLISCAVWGGMVWWNFGKGLKQAVLARPGARTFWGGVVGFFSNDSVESLQSKEQDIKRASDAGRESQSAPEEPIVKDVSDVSMLEWPVRSYPIAGEGNMEQNGRLSEEARAGIREKYAAKSQHVSAGDKRKRTDEEDDIGSSGSHDTRKGEVAGRPHSLASNLHAKSANRVPLNLGRLPTSSVRVNSETQAAIGPTSNRTTSIARLFTPKRTDGTKQSGLSLYRDDPITCGYLTEAMAKDLFAFFMQRLADRLFIFDVFLHTYEYVRDSSTFLFCAILATAARFSPVTISQVTQQRCLALAKDHMLKVFSDNDKTEETIQALYILTEYKEIEDEDGYLLLGMAW
ncbi:hypothetical protein B9479_003397 [Cryptococcus floricola]|uniref:Uncharacterized protein n=1 Tax=Cryptococcus floricola TaxID=2591691 RepID=A0A5D3AZF1_9TREE|nr:hypothetical protein B9479_003397 [Cryptococcus floricola]